MAVHERVAAGRVALAQGDWDVAAAAFTQALNEAPGDADALDGLGKARWWSKDPEGALGLRTRAYRGYRAGARCGEAVRTAVWLAREYRSLYRNANVARGWLARARTLAESCGDAVAGGWVLLAESELTADSGATATAADLAGAAVDRARAAGSADLEIAALALLGTLEIARGNVEDGVATVDEAMAAATAGEGEDLQSIGEAFCALMEAATLLGDMGPVNRWSNALRDFRGRHDFAPLLAYPVPDATGLLSSYCGSCCGGVYLVTGRLDDAEAELVATLARLEEAGVQSRCVHPVTQLADLRVLQGRLEEAAALLARYEDLPECTRTLAALDLAAGRPGVATQRLRSGIVRLAGRPLAALGLWTLLVDAALACDDSDAAAAAARHVADVADLTGSAVHRAEAQFAGGKAAAARGDPEAVPLLRDAAGAFGDVGLPVAACRARLGYARALAAADRGSAVAEARAALTALERLGATLEADAAAALLRSLGVRGRTGPKQVGDLSRREQEVLALISNGLSNAEIAQRLFISTKTAGHHVSNILAKLGLRSRTEAAAYAVLHLPRSAVK